MSPACPLCAKPLETGQLVSPPFPGMRATANPTPPLVHMECLNPHLRFTIASSPREGIHAYDEEEAGLSPDPR